jgi:D-xylose transport system substrate-binding protein
MSILTGRARVLLGAAVLLVAALVVGFATTRDSKADDHLDVAVLLPNYGSARWQQSDAPAFQKAFAKAGVAGTVVNAGGDPAVHAQQAVEAMSRGAKVLILANVDADTDASIAAVAHRHGVKVVYYDSLALKGGGDYYVSFNNQQVGALQGKQLVQCMGGASATPRVLMLDGSPDDNNAGQFAAGARSVLDPLVKAGKATVVAEDSVAGWDPVTGAKVLTKMLDKNGKDVQGVLAANDGLGGAAIEVLKKAGLKGIPVTGQDATLDGVKAVIAGTQCMTVYKSPQVEAGAAMKLTLSLLAGHGAPAGFINGRTDDGATTVPSFLGTPVAVTKANVKSLLIDSGVYKRSEVCAGSMAQACSAAGI